MSKAAEREILRVVDDYRTGIYRADGVLLLSAFHEKAVMNGFFGSDLTMSNPALFIEDIVSHPSRESQGDAFELAVEHIFVQGDIASVLVSESGFQGERKSANCFHLIRIDGIWSIVSRLFTTFE